MLLPLNELSRGSDSLAEDRHLGCPAENRQAATLSARLAMNRILATSSKSLSLNAKSFAAIYC